MVSTEYADSDFVVPVDKMFIIEVFRYIKNVSLTMVAKVFQYNIMLNIL
jgi:hypothetical protein